MINYILRVLSSLLGPAGIVLNVDYLALNAFFGYVRGALYFLPINTFLTVTQLLLGIMGFKIIISLVKTILACIPLA